jgi:hypothetical protein
MVNELTGKGDMVDGVRSIEIGVRNEKQFHMTKQSTNRIYRGASFWQ